MKFLLLFVGVVAAINQSRTLPLGECVCYGETATECHCGDAHTNVTVAPMSSCPCFDAAKKNHAVVACQVCPIEMQPSIDLSKYSEVVHVDGFNCMKVNDDNTASPAPCNGVQKHVKPVTVRKHTANGPQIYCNCLIKGANDETIPCPCAVPRPPQTTAPGTQFPPQCSCGSDSSGNASLACGCAISSIVDRNVEADADADIVCLCKPEGSSGRVKGLMTRCPCNGKESMLGRLSVPV